MKNRYNGIMFFLLVLMSLLGCNENAPTESNTNIEGMVFVHGGSFQMGSIDGQESERPVHSILLDDFYISKYEITHKEFIKFLNIFFENVDSNNVGTEFIDMENPHCAIGHKQNEFYFRGNFNLDNENTPATTMSWAAANAYCKWSNGRLPTEAEWEYAARGGVLGKNFNYSGSNNIETVGWYYYNSDGEVYEVGLKLPNELGICDMTGNASEWCSDWYETDYYSQSPTNNPQGPLIGKRKTIRGGDFQDDEYMCRISHRSSASPTFKAPSVGFRIVFDKN